MAMILGCASEDALREHLPCHTGTHEAVLGGGGVQGGRIHSQSKRRSHKAVPGPTWEQARQERRESWVRPPVGSGKVGAEPQDKGEKRAVSGVSAS